MSQSASNRKLFHCPDCPATIMGPESAINMTVECEGCGVEQEYYAFNHEGP